jgi:hypothetical protein
MSKNTFQASFGDIPVRFVLIDGIAHISKDDLYSILFECHTKAGREIFASMFEAGLSFMGDSKDRQTAIIGESEIGQAVHFHAAGNLIVSISELTHVDSEELRESSFRVNALLRWYVSTLPAVHKHFKVEVAQMLKTVANRLDRIDPPYVVEVVFEDGIYTAQCAEIGLVTEEKTYEALTERVWEIAPELVECNLPGVDPENIRIKFEQIQSASAHRMAN